MSKKCSNKKCHLAGKLQPLTNFYKKTFTADGRDYWCITCRIEDTVSRQKEKNKKSNETSF